MIDKIIELSDNYCSTYSTIMLLLVVCLGLSFSVFPFPPRPDPLAPSYNYISLLSTIKSFYVVNDRTQYSPELLGGYITHLSTNAEKCAKSFNVNNNRWDELSSLTAASAM